MLPKASCFVHLSKADQRIYIGISATMVIFSLLLQVLLVLHSAAITAYAFPTNGSGMVSITRTNKWGKYLPGDLVFHDEFDQFDLEMWSHEITLGGQTFDFQMYVNSRENSFTKDGKLFIKPTLTSQHFGEDFVFAGQLTVQGGENERCTNSLNFGCFRSGSYPRIINPVMSAKIYTMSSFYFLYGRVEIRAKLPSGDWLWPSIRLQPRFNAYGDWPKSGQINILESRGNRKYFETSTGKNVGAELVTSALFFGPHHRQFSGNEKGEHLSEPGRGFDQDFHIYELEWTDDHITFSVDGQEVRSVKPEDGGFWDLGHFNWEYFNPWAGAPNKRMAPFDQKFYIEVSLAVGGNVGYFPDQWFSNLEAPKPWHNGDRIGGFLNFYKAMDDWYPTWNRDSCALEVDYIRVYAV